MCDMGDFGIQQEPAGNVAGAAEGQNDLVESIEEFAGRRGPGHRGYVVVLDPYEGRCVVQGDVVVVRVVEDRGVVGAVAVVQAVVGGLPGDGHGPGPGREVYGDLLCVEVNVVQRGRDATGRIVQVRLGHPVPDPVQLEPGLQGVVSGSAAGDRE